MISRRRILSKSRDDINFLGNTPTDDTEDVWYQKEKLFKDHIHEVLSKWNQIDDEIWAKVIILEKNRRVAKAYARAPVLTINGSDSGFDGFRIGLSGFQNPLRDKKTEECRRHIGNGVKIKMDESGNILIKRLSRSNVFIKRTTLDDECAISNEILKLSHGALEVNKAFKLFDMKKFQVNVANELKRSYPNRRRLENQCLSSIVFVKNESEQLKCPIWMLVINMVAIEMLKSQIPIDVVTSINTRHPLPIPQEEETYSTCGNAKMGPTSSRNSSDNFRDSSSNISSLENAGVYNKSDIPPQLPPRKQMESCSMVQRDYHHELKAVSSSIKRIPSKKNKDKDIKRNRKKMDDPYYCGFRARIPNFVAKLTGKNNTGHHKQQNPKSHDPNCRHYQSKNQQIYGYLPSAIEQHVRKVSNIKHPNMKPSSLWHAKSLDSGLDTAASSQSPYNNYTMFYRFQAQPSRGYIPVPPGTVYIGEWD